MKNGAPVVKSAVTTVIAATPGVKSDPPAEVGKKACASRRAVAAQRPLPRAAAETHTVIGTGRAISGRRRTVNHVLHWPKHKLPPLSNAFQLTSVTKLRQKVVAAAAVVEAGAASAVVTAEHRRRRPRQARIRR